MVKAQIMVIVYKIVAHIVYLTLFIHNNILPIVYLLHVFYVEHLLKLIFDIL